MLNVTYVTTDEADNRDNIAEYSRKCSDQFVILPRYERYEI